MKKGAILGVICCSLIAGNALASTTDLQKLIGVDFFMKYKPYYYQWDEKGVDVEEEGWVHGAEIGANVKYHDFVLTKKFTILGGEVDYDGATWGGDSISSNTEYDGWSLELDVGKSFKVSKCFEITPYVMLGYEYWKRHLENTLFSLGYAEKWKVWYTGVGVRPVYNIGSYYLFGDVYVRYNFDVRNEVELLDVTVKPDEAWSYGVEAGIGVKNVAKKGLKVEFSAFYAHDNFDASSWKYSSVIDDYVRQPESDRDILGFKLGVKF